MWGTSGWGGLAWTFNIKPTPDTELHTPCFPPNAHSSAKASHETLMQPDQKELFTMASWVKPRLLVERSPGFTQMTEDEWGRCCLLTVCLQNKVRLITWFSSLADFDLSSQLGARCWRTSQRADYDNLWRRLSALCLPTSCPLTPYLD